MARTLAARGGRLSDRTSRPRTSDDAWVHDRAPGVAHSSAPVTDTLVVSNLHYEVERKDLVSVFGQIGTLVRDPVIKFDRSGRSTGVAFVQYETSAEATRAMRQFNGVLAKGQPMRIEYDRKLPRHPASETKSLASRIEKPPLLERLNSSTRKVDSLVNASRTNGSGAVRSRATKRKVGGKPQPAGKPVREKKVHKTAEDLDKELDGYMGPGAPAAPAKAADGDVEMA